MQFRIILFGFLGFLFGGPLGAVLGALVGIWINNQNRPRVIYGGRQSTSRRRETQTAFFQASFMVMGKVAKADGQVNKEEIQLAQALMNEMRLSPQQRQDAMNLFNSGKQPDSSVSEVLEAFRQSASGSLIQMFLELQLQAAYADGGMSQAEQSVLLEACQYLGVNRFTFDLLHQRFQAQRAFYSHQGGFSHQSGHQGNYQSRQSSRDELREAYATLGVKESDNDRDIKRAYRKLMSEHHPDKLVAKGLPEEMMEMAKRKTQEIQGAYDLVSQHRKQNRDL